MKVAWKYKNYEKTTKKERIFNKIFLPPFPHLFSDCKFFSHMGKKIYDIIEKNKLIFYTIF